MSRLTISELQAMTGLPRHVINYALERFGPPPRGKVGMTRIWDADDLPQILDSLARTGNHPRPSSDEEVDCG